jgi:hypothetical protein
VILAILIAAVSALYATAGQAGGTGFVAVMALAAFPTGEIRVTALALNIVAAGYATARLISARTVDWQLLGTLLIASAPAAFFGGCIVLGGKAAAIVTGLLLLAACAALLIQQHSAGEGRTISTPLALAIGVATGFASGLSGIGGGVFLAPLLIVLAHMSPKRVAGLSPPFILANSIVGLAAVLFAGQRLSFASLPLMLAALGGSIIGTAVGLRWRSESVIRYILAIVLAVAGAELIIRAR